MHDDGRRRATAVAGMLSLAALLSAGACGSGKTEEATSNVRAIAPQASGASANSRSAASEPSEGTQSPEASATSSIDTETKKKIDEAHRRMAEDGVPLQRPVTPRKTVAAAASIMRDTVGSLKGGGIVRVVSARGDLTGQSELAWVAGGVAKHRNVDCSQTFKFATNPKPTRKPNLLLCWRTSARKSVVAVVVDPQGHPSKDKAVSELERKWRRMG